MPSIEFRFALGESVTVLAIEMQGRIDSVSRNLNGEQYRVVYWNDGERHQVWLYEWELAAKA
jgi:hypothetical protein